MEDSRLEGREVGFEAGCEETKLENARNLLDILSDDVIAEKIGLSLETVQSLRQK